MKRKTQPAKFDRCVKAVKKRGGSVSPYAVCKAALKKRKRGNPAELAAEAFEDFQGRPVEKIVTVQEKVHYHKHLAAAGQLRAMVVIPVRGKGTVRMSDFKGAKLAFNEDRNQLFIVGGDQSVKPAVFGIQTDHEHQTLGKVKSIDYATKKDHLGKEGGDAVYTHRFRTVNEDGKHVTVRVAEYPDLIYFTRDQRLMFSGGDYEILPEGINR